MKRSTSLLLALLPMAASCSSNGLTRVPYRIEIVQNEDYSFSIYQPFDLSEVPAYIGKEGGKRTDYILPGETANAYFDAASEKGSSPPSPAPTPRNSSSRRISSCRSAR